MPALSLKNLFRSAAPIMTAVMSAPLFLAPFAPAEPQLILPCEVVEVYDGDTVTVELKMRARVRMLQCWAPELNQPGGREAKQELQNLSSGRSAFLTIPLGGVDRLDDVFTFGRILGDVRMQGQSLTLAEQIVERGLASTKKGGDLGE